MKQLLIINIIIYLSFISCETIIDVNIPNSEPKLVINSYIISEQSFPAKNRFLHVSNSMDGVGYISDFDSTFVSGINNAEAIIYEIENQNIIEEFPLSFDEECNCYIDFTNNFIPKEQTTYELNVSAEGFDMISAIETTPSKPNYIIDNFELITPLDSEEEGELCNFNIILQDPPNEDNYYRLNIVLENFTNGKDISCSYEVDDPSFLIPINRYSSSNSYYQGKNGYFTDEIFDGEERNLYVSVNKENKKKYNSIRVVILAYSKNLYEFNATRKEQRRETGNILFNSEPVFIKSNINGGYGIFGAKTTSEKIYIAGQWFDN